MLILVAISRQSHHHILADHSHYLHERKRNMKHLCCHLASQLPSTTASALTTVRRRANATAAVARPTVMAWPPRPAGPDVCWLPLPRSTGAEGAEGAEGARKA